MKPLSYLNYKVCVIFALAIIQLKSADIASAQDRGRDPTGTSDPTSTELMPEIKVEMQFKSSGIRGGPAHEVGLFYGYYSEQRFPSGFMSHSTTTEESSLSSGYVTDRIDAMTWDENALETFNNVDFLEDIFTVSFAKLHTFTDYWYDLENGDEHSFTSRTYTGYARQTRFRVSAASADHPPVHFHALKITSAEILDVNDTFNIDWSISPDEVWPFSNPYKFHEVETIEHTLEPYVVSLPAGELTTEWIDFKTPLVDNQESYVTLSPVHLRVDANRDGTIDDQDTTRLEKPFRFWVNNDQDDVEEDEPASVTTEDSADIQISTKRDLEDFCRLYINEIKPLSVKLRAGEYQMGLRFANIRSGAPSIRCWPNQSREGDLSYLSDDEAAADQISTTCFPVEGDTTMIPATYWEDSENPSSVLAGPVHIIFEGLEPGEGELVVTIHDENGEKLVECGSLHLKLLDVREMYERAKVPNEAEDIPNPWVDDSPPAQTWVKDDLDWPPAEDPDATDQTTIFVHGWRMTYRKYLVWSDTSYKRLWHQGFKGKFYTFRWATFSGDNNGLPDDFDDWLEGVEGENVPRPAGLTYNASEYRAWLCGPTLADFVNQLPNPRSRSLFAHSMGNVIAGAALRSGMVVRHYAMCNAAVSAMCYDSSSLLHGNDNIWIPGTPSVWQVTPDTHSNSTVRAYGLNNKFNYNNLQMHNFTLSEDTALSRWITNNQWFKPELGVQYYYIPASINAYHTFPLAFRQTDLSPFRSVVSLSEAMAYVTKSLTAPAGRTPSTRGAIDSTVGMDDWFGEVHSGQWRLNYEQSKEFWFNLSESLNLTRTD